MTVPLEVAVVGGGQAGLAIGYFLKQQGRRFTILEASDAPAAAWRARWDSLRLFTSVRYDSLPGRVFPGDADSYPGRDDVVAYLTLETAVAGLFVVLAAASVTATAWLLVVGYVGHGLKDAWQERRHYVANTRWWPPFCAAVDWLLAAILVVAIAAGAHFH